MGSVFGSPLQGFALITKDNAPAPTTAERTAAVMPIDVLTRDVAALQSQVMDLKSLMAKMEEEIKIMKEPIIVHAPSMPFSNTPIVVGVDAFMTGEDKSVSTPNPLAPEKKKPGRPKKVA